MPVALGVNGGVLGSNNLPTATTFRGVFTPNEVARAIALGFWPVNKSQAVTGVAGSGALGTLTVGATADPYFEYTTLLLPGNGTNGAQNNTFLDGSTNNFTITRNGNTTQGTFSPFSQTGWGNYFDGSGDYLTVPDNAVLELGTSNFTIELWVYPTVFTANYLIGKMTNSLTASGFLIRLADTTGVALFYASSNGSSWDIAGGIGSVAVTLNAWNHIAVSRSGSSFRLWVNGSSGGTATSASAIQNNTAVVGIGDVAGGGGPTTGYISNVRIVNGSAVYDPSSSTITVPTAPLTAITNTSLLTCQSNRFIDNSTNNFTITRNGDTRVVAFSPFNPTASWSAATYGGSGYFDGSGDYLQGPVNSAFAFGTGEYCMEGWIYMTSAPASPSSLIDLRRAAPNYNAPWLNVTSGYKLALRDGTLGADVVTGATNIQLNTWTHVAVTRQVTSNAGTRIFLNGVLDANSITNNSNYSNGALTLATAGDSLGNFMFTGYMSDVRITKGSVPTSYQTSATTSGTAVFTPPTSPETTTSQGASSPSILLNFTNAGIYDATSKNDLETVGNAQISTTQSKFGGSSMSFDGTGDYLVPNISTSDLYTFGTGAFTVEFWLYLNSTSGVQICIDFRPLATNGPQIILFTNSGVLTFQASSTVRITGSTLSTGQWYHIALSRNGTDTKMFLNGTQTGSTYSSDTTSYTVGANRPAIGADGANLSLNNLNGYLQDVRITKGYARYTANFTAPTAAFPTL